MIASPLLDRFRSELIQIARVAAPNRICIAYHADPDGVAAAALVGAWLRHSTGERPPFVALPIATHEFSFEKLLSYSSSFDCLVTLDLNLYTTKGVVDALALRRQLRVLIVDDHEIKERSVPTCIGFTFLNPRLTGDESMPTSVMATLLCHSEQGLSQPSRIAAVGQVGALGDAALTRFAYVLGRSEMDQEDLQSCVTLISSYYASIDYDDGNDPVFRAIRDWLVGESEGSLLDTIIGKVPSLLRTRQEVNDAVAEFAGQTAGHLDTEGDFSLDYLNVVSPYRIVNLVASRRRRQPGRAVIVVTQKINESLTMAELRRTKLLSDVDLTLLLNCIAKRMSLLSFGGHPPAAGCAFAPGDLKIFLDILVKEVNSWSTHRT